MYFILPREVPIILAIPWRVAAYVLTAAIALGAAWTWYKVAYPQPRPTMLLAGVVLTLIEIIITAATGRYWPAGEALAMIGPTLFVVLVVPLLFPSVPLQLRLATGAFVFLYLGFGLARPILAADPTGTHYRAPYPDPASMGGNLKESFDWDLTSVKARTRGCKALALDVDSPIFERYAGVYLTDHNLMWRSSDGRADLDMGHETPFVGIPEGTDCLVSNQVRSETRWERFLYVGGNRHFVNFLAGKRQGVEIATDPGSGIPMTGVLDIEDYMDGKLRWTIPSAHFLVPNNPENPIRRIKLSSWPISPGRRMYVKINGVVAYEGAIPIDFSNIEIDIPNPSLHFIDLEIGSDPLPSEYVPTGYGVALRKLVLQH